MCAGSAGGANAKNRAAVPALMRDWIGLYLEEDLGPNGVDATSDVLLPAARQGAALVVARERAFVAGLAVAADVWKRCGATATSLAADGGWVEAGAPLLDVKGPARAILRGERLALNVLARMSGVATATRAVVESVAEACSPCEVAATRKTTPGFRWFEKEAVRIAGGAPHRFGLYDAAMVKDNHRAAVGDVGRAVRRLRAAPRKVPIVVEVESEEDALAAAKAGAHWILIDNQPAATAKAWAMRVWERHPAVKVEASGGIRAENVAEYAWADRVSLGALTTSARWIDVSLEWDERVGSQTKAVRRSGRPSSARAAQRAARRGAPQSVRGKTQPAARRSAQSVKRRPARPAERRAARRKPPRDGRTSRAPGATRGRTVRP